MAQDLALFGGQPVRTIPYPIHNTMIKEEEEQLVLEVLRGQHLSGFSARPGDRFLGGPKVQELEKKFAELFNVKHAISFNSATTALQGIVSACGIGPGDEVIVPPTTMSATATAVVMQFAVPVFADIEEDTFGLDPKSVLEAITPRTKAILAVNLFGHPAKLEALEKIAREHNLILLEDNAQSALAHASGRLTGTIGKMGVQSLNYHKAIQTGEGGMVVTNDDQAAEHLRLLRNHGEVIVGHLPDFDDSRLVNMVGSNYRLTELQAAVGIPQVKKLTELVSIRQKLATLLTKELATFPFFELPKVRENCSHSYYLYPIRYQAEKLGISRQTFAQALRAEGIAITEGYVRPIYLEPMYQKKLAYGSKGFPFVAPVYEGTVRYDKGLCPTAERLYEKEFLITDICKHPNGEKEIFEFVSAVQKIVANISALKKHETNH